MVLWAHSDASYLTAPKGRFRSAGYHILSSRPSQPDPIALTVHPQTMDTLTFSAKSCAMWWPAQPKLNWELCLSMPNMHIQSALHWKNCVIHNLPHHYKQITTQPVEVSMILSSRNSPRILTWNFIGSKTGYNRNNFTSYFIKYHPAMHHQAVCATYLHIPSQHINYYACLTDEFVPRTSESVLIGTKAICMQQPLCPSGNYYKLTQRHYEITQVTWTRAPGF